MTERRSHGLDIHEIFHIFNVSFKFGGVFFIQIIGEKGGGRVKGI
jgi:hypothetical protein